jgi:hypothetical protein
MSRLKQNMYNLDFDFKPEDMTPPQPDPLAPIRYFCVFWAGHLLNGNSLESKKEMADDGAVFSFLEKHFLHWIESLSLLGNLSDGVTSIRKLLKVYMSSHSVLYHSKRLYVPDLGSQLATFLNDAETFVLSHGSFIERAPLQTYGSAFVFIIIIIPTPICP